MEQTTAVIIAATITGIFGPTLTLLVKYLIEQDKFPTTTKERLKKLIGTSWKGYFEQLNPSNNELEKVDITVNLKRNGRIINGTLDFTAYNKKWTMLLKNGIFDGEILKIEYSNIDKGIFQKGSFIVELNDYGNELFGCFVGYSPSMKRIISGEVKLNN